MKNAPKRILLVGLIMVFVIALVVAVYPFWPAIEYYFSPKLDKIPGIPESSLVDTEEPEDIASGSLNNENQEILSNLLIIPKIGVKISIVEGEDESVLNKGAWRLPETSTPDKGSNTAIAGHRWKYRPPSEKTFYLLDKVEVEDTFQIFWEGKEYNYKIVSTNIVLPTDVWVLNPTTNPTVTLITCTPLFSTEKRLIVRAELVTD